MRRVLFTLLVFTLVVEVKAQSFVQCHFGEALSVGHSEGVSVRRLSIHEASGEIGASVFIPDREGPVPGIVLSHSAIHGIDRNADLSHFVLALARAGAASIVLDGTIEWQAPNDRSRRAAHVMSCAGQWLLLNVKLDRKRLAHAGPSTWGGAPTAGDPSGDGVVHNGAPENQPHCLPGESPCFKPIAHLNFGTTEPYDFNNTNALLTAQGQRTLARWTQRILNLKEVQPDWLSGGLEIAAK